MSRRYGLFFLYSSSNACSDASSYSCSHPCTHPCSYPGSYSSSYSSADPSSNSGTYAGPDARASHPRAHACSPDRRLLSYQLSSIESAELFDRNTGELPRCCGWSNLGGVGLEG
jgi:hypothetical protein